MNSPSISESSDPGLKPGNLRVPDSESPEVPANLEILPFELLYDIVSRLEPEDIVRLCSTSTSFRNICRSGFDRLWKRLYQRDIDSEVPNNAREEYLRIVTNIENAARGQPEKTDKLGYKIQMAAMNNYSNLVYRFLKKAPDVTYYNYMLLGASEGDNFDLFREAIEISGGSGLDLKKAFYIARDRGGKNSDRMIREIFKELARDGNADLLEELREEYYLGEDPELDELNNLYVIAGAAAGGHQELLNRALREEFFSELMSRENVARRYDYLFKGAGEGGHFDIIESKMKPKILRLVGIGGLVKALKGLAKINAVDLAINLLNLAKEKGYEFHQNNLLTPMYEAAKYGNLNFVQFLMNAGLSNYLKQQKSQSFLNKYDKEIRIVEKRGLHYVADYLRKYRPPLQQ